MVDVLRGVWGQNGRWGTLPQKGARIVSPKRKVPQYSPLFSNITFPNSCKPVGWGILAPINHHFPNFPMWQNLNVTVARNSSVIEISDSLHE